MGSVGRLALVLLAVPARGLGGQWLIGADVTAMWFGGTSHDTSAASDDESFRPHRPTSFGLSVDKRFTKIGVGLRLSYAEAAVADEGDAGFIGLNNFFACYEAAPELSYRVARTGTGAEFRVHGGPLLDLWSVTGEDGLRSRWGAHAAVSVELPFGRHLAGAVRAGGALTPSVFKPGELPPQFVRQTMRRGSVTLGLRYRL